jgi:hypothetical protein
MSLCFDCNLRHQNATAQQLQLLMQLQQSTRDDMDEMLGLPRRRPAPVVVQRGPMTYNNISVNNSVVGAINTGNVKRIDVAIERIKQQGSAGAADFAESLKQFTEATLEAADLDQTAKDEMTEQLSFLTDQIQTKSEERKPGMIGRTLTNISTAAAASNSLVTLWPHLHHLFNAVFGLS